MKGKEGVRKEALRRGGRKKGRKEEGEEGGEEGRRGARTGECDLDAAFSTGGGGCLEIFRGT